MSLKTSNRKMRSGGFMCHSQASAAVCMSTLDPRSVVVPRTRRHNRSVFVDDTRFINYANYSKLVDKKCVSVSASKIKKKSHDQVSESRELQKTPTENVFQVVVMRVAIHCQGCDVVKLTTTGVTSFSIDVESKRVTVMGHISPVVVLESISKVKRAELWNC
ncbi:PREDICTED: protein SODIUM POTASSIUM ROOT DEFECTIVE 1-like isoform X2 [Lupinus angustifolius]|uniref:protein SODIUM POTASSIUM ROOT DEFECTIVE 1-like isoform X2 n=1 Tax=Lupinus angustifolius TaxID=3871 RepID=UPI00092E998C|nr:PREDICTED: protein SODIUM POTASSIUM ROOT DEFECTIVE 1-like isoform X2 [Lupinus angustifolius]